MKISHILMTTDFSPESTRPLQDVAALAKEQGARLSLLHVVHELYAVPHGAPLAPPVQPIDSQRRVEEATAQLKELRDQLSPDLDVEIVAIAAASFPEAIVGFAKEKDVSMIALGTHGRTGLKHLALGSVAEAVLRQSPVPVLCFPLKRKE